MAVFLPAPARFVGGIATAGPWPELCAGRGGRSSGLGTFGARRQLPLLMMDKAASRSFRERFHAWWEGIDLPPPPKPAPEPLLLDRVVPEPAPRSVGNGAIKPWPH